MISDIYYCKRISFRLIIHNSNNNNINNNNNSIYVFNILNSNGKTTNKTITNQSQNKH